MPTIDDLVSKHGLANEQTGTTSVWYGEVAAPAPTSPTDDLFVIIPDMGFDRKWGPCEWGGKLAPVLGSPVLVVFDSRQQLWAITAIPDTGGVTSWNARTGAVVPVTGDYAVAQITGAAPLANPIFTGDPQAPTPTVGDNDQSIATTAFVAAAIAAAIAAVAQTPTGSVTQFAGSTPPSGWLLCDGSAVSRTGATAALFAAIGTTYGVGNGSTTFNLPDLTGRVPVGRKTGTFGTLGATGGEETHVLTVAEIAGHSHTFVGTAMATHNHTFTGTAMGPHTHSDSAGTPAGTVSSHTHRGSNATNDMGYQNLPQGSGGGAIYVRDIAGITGATGVTNANWTTGATQPTFTGTPMTAHSHSDSAGTPAGTNNPVSAGTPAGTNNPTGGDGAHNNLQPYLVMNYIIKT